MIRVLHILGALEVGGTEAQVFGLLSRLDRTRWRPAVAWLAGPGEFAPRFRAAGIETFDLRSRDPFRAGTVRRLLRLLHRFKPHVVHTHLALADAVGGAAARLAAVPAVVSTRHLTGPAEWFPPALVAEAAVSALPHRIVTASEGVARRLVEVLGMDPARIVPIRYGQPELEGRAARDPQAARRLRYHLGLPPDAEIVACVARLSERKGLLDLLRAAALLREARPKARYLLIGGGELRPRLEQAVREMELGGIVHLRGFRKNVSPVLAGADLLVLPSHFEGFGLVLLEAMAAGLPVVGTSAGAIPEVVVHGETGLVVPPRSPDALAAAILDLLAHPERAEAMGRAGRDRVRAEFAMESMVAAHTRLYESLVAAPRPAAAAPPAQPVT